MPNFSSMLKITDRKPGEWTADDLAQLPEGDGNRYEIINGVLYVTPAPVSRHQRAVGNLYSLIGLYCEQSLCGEAFVAPFDVHFSLKSVVEPDIVYVAREIHNIVEKWVYGVPTLLVEVLSSKPKLDRVIKLNLYAEQRVPHYWLVDPAARTLEALELEGSSYRVAWSGQESDTFHPTLFPGLSIPLRKLWVPPWER